MAFTAPRTWTTGEIVTASMLNQQIRDNELILATPPSCRAYSSGPLTQGNSGNFEGHSLDSERWDTDSMLSGTSGQIVANTPGRYFCAAHARYAANATGQRGLALVVNGNAGSPLTGTYIAVQMVDAAASGVTDLSVSTVWTFAAADKVEIGYFQSSGGSLTIDANAAYSPELVMTWESN